PSMSAYFEPLAWITSQARVAFSLNESSLRQVYSAGFAVSVPIGDGGAPPLIRPQPHVCSVAGRHDSTILDLVAKGERLLAERRRGFMNIRALSDTSCPSALSTNRCYRSC